MGIFCINRKVYNNFMLTDKDIDKLTSVLASKADVKEIKTDMEYLKELVQGLIISNDSINQLVI